MKKISILIFLIFVSSLFSQVDENKISRTIPASQLIKEILADNHKPIFYENVRFEGEVILQKTDNGKLKELEHIRISKRIEFNNCTIEAFYAQKCIFDSSLSFSNMEFNKEVDLTKAKFNNSFQVEGIDFNDNVFFSSVLFKDSSFRIVNFNGEYTVFGNSVFLGKTEFFVINSYGKLLDFTYVDFYDFVRFTHSAFDSEEIMFQNTNFYDNVTLLVVIFNGKKTVFSLSKFHPDSELFVSFCKFNSEVEWMNTYFNSSINFIYTSFNNTFLFWNTIFAKNSIIFFKKCNIQNVLTFFTPDDSITLSYISDNKEEIELKVVDNDTIWFDSPSSSYKILSHSVTTNNKNFFDESKIYFDNCSIAEGMLDLSFDNVYDSENNFNHLGDPEIQTLKDVHTMYSQLKSINEFNGNWDEADAFYYEWKQIERRYFWKDFWKNRNKQWYNPLHLFESILYNSFNWLNWFSCGYGVKPLWIFPFAFFIVVVFAIIYFFVPQKISNLEEHLISKDKITKQLRNMDKEKIKELFQEDDFDFGTHKQDLIEDITSSIGTDELAEKLNLSPKTKYNFDFFWHCFYFSFSTFTTIGIGDWYPSGKLNKAVVMVEGALGWLCLGLFITTYANILLR